MANQQANGQSVSNASHLVEQLEPAEQISLMEAYGPISQILAKIAAERTKYKELQVKAQDKEKLFIKTKDSLRSIVDEQRVQMEIYKCEIDTLKKKCQRYETIVQNLKKLNELVVALDDEGLNKANAVKETTETNKISDSYESTVAIDKIEAIDSTGVHKSNPKSLRRSLNTDQTNIRRQSKVERRSIN